MPSTTPPTMSPTRVFISRAALLVKVTAKISPGRARPVARMWAMRTVSTRVLPVPAPARTSTGPSSVSTASRCSGLSPARYGAPAAACARAAMPPGAGAIGSIGSILRFKGSAKVTDGADSHVPKMAPGRGFYEAYVSRTRCSAISAFTRVFDALWRCTADPGSLRTRRVGRSQVCSAPLRSATCCARETNGNGSLHILVDQYGGVLAVFLQERGKILGRAGGRFEEVLVGEVGELLA